MPVNYELPQYEEIELDFEESSEALRVGREQKFFKIKREEYRKKLEQPEVFASHTAEQLFEAFSQNFKFADKAHEAKIKQLCCYFAKDTRFRGDLNRGILLMGNIGNGKTSIMRLFQANMNHSYRLVSMLDISFDYKNSGKEGGEGAVKEYYTNYTRSADIYGATEYGFCFDDLGTEEVPAKHYGESKNLFAEILQLRYNNQAQVPFNSTHATTNKTEDELKVLYGSRAYDRMKEMFNVMVFEHDSFR